MPLLKITSSKPFPAGERQQVLGQLSEAVARMLDKPESYVMVIFEHNEEMMLGGTDEPLAYLELKSIGLPESATTDISKYLCALVESILGIPGNRVYIEFSDIPRIMWGWNSKTFA